MRREKVLVGPNLAHSKNVVQNFNANEKLTALKM
jgi:hypothetical protein